MDGSLVCPVEHSRALYIPSVVNEVVPAKHEEAAIVIQRVWRGHRVRQRIILVSQVHPLLCESLSDTLTKKIIKVISRVISRDSLVLYDEKGENKRFFAKKKVYIWSVPSERQNGIRSVHILSRIHDYEFFWGKDSFGVDIKGITATQGSYKKVFFSMRLTFPMTFRGDGVWHPLVVKNIKDMSTQSLCAILKGMNTVRTLFGEDAELFGIGGIPFSEETYFRDGTPIYEMKEEWYNGDMKTLLRCGRLPLSKQAFSPSNAVQGRPPSEGLKGVVSFGNEMLLFLDVIEGLEHFHEKGYIHGDVKLNNLLVKWSARSESTVYRWRGYLSDYDLCREFGFDDRIDALKPEFYWCDTCYRHGYFFPSADHYGVAIALGCYFLGNRLSLMALNRESIITDSFQRDIISFVVRKFFSHCEELSDEYRMVCDIEERKADVREKQKTYERGDVRSGDFVDSIFSHMLAMADDIQLSREERKQMRFCYITCKTVFDIYTIVRDVVVDDITLSNYVLENKEEVKALLSQPDSDQRRDMIRSLMELKAPRMLMLRERVTRILDDITDNSGKDIPIAL